MIQVLGFWKDRDILFMLNLELSACNPRVIERHYKVNPCKRMELTQGKGKLRNERNKQDKVLMTSFNIQLCLKLDYLLDYLAKWLKSKTLTPPNLVRM